MTRRGWTGKEKRRAVQRQQEISMRDAFEAARAGVSEFASKVEIRVRANKDGSVDGEIKVRVKRGVTPRRAFVALEESTWWPTNHWMSHLLSFGTRAGQEEEHAHYRKRRGHPDANVISTYFGRTELAGYNAVGRSFLTARDLASRVQVNGRKKVEVIATRLHWNPSGKQPKRRY